MYAGKNSSTVKRVKSIDIIRGIAVVQMVFWQIFDFFAITDIYRDSPYFIKTFNAPLHFSVLVLFLSMSGASLYISISKRLKRGETKNKIFMHTLKRYGMLIFISLFFTTFVFDFCTFFRWEEAIQGIGLTAIVTSIIILGLSYDVETCRKTILLLLLTITFILLQPLRADYVWAVTRDHMFCNTNMDISQFPTSLLFNLSMRGFFSFTNLLPLMLVGILLGISLESGILKEKTFSVACLGVLLIAVAIIMNLYSAIDFYARSYSSLLLEIGIAISLFSIVEYIINTKTDGLTNNLTKNIFNFFIPFGMSSLVAYFGHFILVYKLLQIMAIYTGVQLIGTMSPATSGALSLLLVLFFHKVTAKWIKMKQKSKH